MKLIYAIDSDGLHDFANDKMIDDEFEIPEGYTDVQPMLKNSNGTYTGFYKAKWTGSEWAEGATQDYIDSLKVTPQPTDVEILQQQNAQMLLQSAQQAQTISDLQTQNAAIMLQLAQSQPSGGAS
ncbi:MAG: hypothetical protein ABF969_04310 [Sporolactobacillus sp.]